jgi:hypothetical protein
MMSTSVFGSAILEVLPEGQAIWNVHCNFANLAFMLQWLAEGNASFVVQAADIVCTNAVDLLLSCSSSFTAKRRLPDDRTHFLAQVGLLRGDEGQGVD